MAQLWGDSGKTMNYSCISMKTVQRKAWGILTKTQMSLAGPIGAPGCLTVYAGVDTKGEGVFKFCRLWKLKSRGARQ